MKNSEYLIELNKLNREKEKYKKLKCDVEKQSKKLESMKFFIILFSLIAILSDFFFIFIDITLMAYSTLLLSLVVWPAFKVISLQDKLEDDKAKLSAIERSVKSYTSNMSKFLIQLPAPATNINYPSNDIETANKTIFIQKQTTSTNKTPRM